MLLKILGWIWIVTGILFLIKPEWLRRRLQKKGSKKVRRILFGLALMVGLALIGATWKMPGLLPKIVMVLGVVAIIYGFFLFNSKSSEKIFSWFAAQDLKFFRIWAGVQIAFGAFLYYVH